MKDVDHERHLLLDISGLALGLLLLVGLSGLAIGQTPTSPFAFGPSTTYDVVVPPGGITTADVNGDGTLDVIVGTSLGIAVLLNKGDGTLAQPAFYNASIPFDGGIVATDLNDDGLPDLVFPGGGGIGVLLNKGDGSFGPATYYPSGTGLFNVSVATGDFFHDGHNSVAMVEVGFFGCCSTLTIFRNRGDGTFDKTSQFDLSDGAITVTSADVNNDGYPDLITANGNTNGLATVSVFINLKNGTFAPPVNYPTNGSRVAAEADLNHDGKLDLILFACGAAGCHHVGIMLGNGDGTFAPAVYYPVGPQGFAGDVAIADFDLDGSLDLAVTTGPGIVILRNNGDGTFAQPVSFAVGRSSGNIVAADLDGNGDSDLVVTDDAQNPSADAIHVLLNQKLPPNLSGFVFPDRGGNAGTVTVTISFPGLPAATAVKLIAPGQPDIPGLNPVLINQGGQTVLQASFNLQGASPGVYQVVLLLPDGTTLTLPKNFIVEQGGAPDVWMDLVGFNQIRAGRAQTYYVTVGNRGNVDAGVSRTSVTFPSFLSSDSDPQFTSTSGQTTDSQTLLSFDLFLAPGDSTTIPIRLTSPDLPQFAHQTFQLNATTTSASAPGVLGAQIPNSGPNGCRSNHRGNVSGANGPTIAPSTVADLAFGAGFRCDDLVTIVAIAGAESQYKSGLVDGNYSRGGSLCSRDWGLWQMNDFPGNQFPTQVIDSPRLLTDLPYAAQVAYDRFQLAGFSNWNTFKDGSYLQYMPMAQLAVQSLTSCHPVPNEDFDVHISGMTVEMITSGDPNEKVGSQGSGSQQYISGATPLRYAIFFSNLSTATAPAQDITVTDQLDLVNEDLRSFSLGPIAFGGQLVSPPVGARSFATTVDLRPANNLLVRIEAHLDISTAVLSWRFTSLDPATNQPPLDPTIGFLPPGGEGSVFFTVTPRPSVQTNTQIQNQARIVFDVNQPISTQTWTNTIDNAKPTSQMLPLAPSQSSPAFTIQWSGTDVGSGIQDFTIFVSDNGAPFTPFLSNTTATSATFPGQNGHTYAFLSIARDLVGNRENPKTTAEATTMVPAHTIPPTTIATVSPAPNANGWNNTNPSIALAATDNPGGSGVQRIVFSATGAQPIASTTVNGTSAVITINTEGITVINFFAVDRAGNVEQTHSLTIKFDETPPTVIPSRTPVPNVNGWNNTSVRVSFSCSDNLSGLAPGSPPADTVVSSEGASQQVSGVCQDLAGNSATATVSGINIDETPPVISGLPAPGCTLWPPNHEFVQVATIAGTDVLSGIASLNVTGTSNEPMDPSDPDIIITGSGLQPRTVQLRAERSGSGTGRIYTLTTTAIDAAGNVVNATSTCTVPHDQGH